MGQYSQKIDLTKFNFIPCLDEMDIWITWGDKTLGHIRYRMESTIPRHLTKFEGYLSDKRDEM